MNYKDFGKKPQRTIFGISIASLFAISLSQFILSSIWIIRTSPYFSKFDSFDYITCVIYHYFAFSLGFSMINCVYIVMVILYGTCCNKGCCMLLFKNTSGIIGLFIFELLTTIASISFGFISSLYTIKSNSTESKCFFYITKSLKELDSQFNQSETYQIWHDELIQKIFDKNGLLSSYLCDSIGIPLLIFTILHIPFIIMMGVSIYFAWKNHSEEDDIIDQQPQVKESLIPKDEGQEKPIGSSQIRVNVQQTTYDIILAQSN